MASYELLDAVNSKHVRTTADVARELNIDEAEAARQLRLAREEGLADVEQDLSASLPDDEREYWHLTREGWAEWDKLTAERDRN